jgi:hypothetical protein
MVNGTTRLIQNAAPSEAVVYAQALILTETIFGHAQFMRWQPKFFRDKISSVIPLRFGGLTSPKITVRPLKQKI